MAKHDPAWVFMRHSLGRTESLRRTAIGLLFGAYDGCSNQTDDYDTDGKLFIKSRVSALVARGGFPLAR